MTPDTQTSLLNLVSNFKAAKAAMEAATAADLHALIKNALEANPTVKAVVWNQYTPRYNDGDPCTFRLNIWDPCRDKLLSKDDCSSFSWLVGGHTADTPDSSEDEVDVHQYMSEDHCYHSGEHVPTTVTPEHNAALKSLLRGIPEELYETILGDGVEVYVTVGGLATAHYEH